MNLLQAIILGLVQGLTEFIPISSTAHLTFIGKLMGLINADHPEYWTSFIAVVQLGTLAAVLIYFYKEVIGIPRGFLKENLAKNRLPIMKQTENSRLGWYIIIGTVPIVVIGYALKKIIEGSFTKDLYVIAISLIVFGLFLGLAELTAKFRKDMSKITWVDALMVGFAQCLALFPGASRSGTTITAGLFLGINRETAARFSFLLSIPAVLASGLLEFAQSLKYISGHDMVTLLVATLAAAISGYASIAFLLRYLRKHSTYLFVVYRLVLGIIIILALTKGII